MMLPNSTDLAFMRNAVRQFFNSTIEICTLTDTKDGFGQSTITVTVNSTVAGEVSAPRGSHRLLIDALRNQGVLNEETYVLKLPYNTTVTMDNIVRTADGKTFDIVNINTEQTSRVMAELIITRRVVNNHLHTNNDY